jgi:hypothetical protein
MKLTVLDPGHFHAALVQKNMYANVDDTVHVYAPAGPDSTTTRARSRATTRGPRTRPAGAW